jgi:hypothetical protein
VLIRMFTGPGPLAELVRDELVSRGVGAEIRSEDPLGAVYGSVISPAGIQSVYVTPEAAERQREAIEEVLSLVSPGEPTEVVPADRPKGRGDEVGPAEPC